MSTGYLRRNTNHNNCESSANTKSYVSEVAQSQDIEQIILNIRRGQYKYYVRGGFSRSRRAVLPPMRVAILCNLDLKQCLFEIKNERVEGAVFQAGLQVFTVNSARSERQPAKIVGWHANAF